MGWFVGHSTRPLGQPSTLHNHQNLLNPRPEKERSQHQQVRGPQAQGIGRAPAFQLYVILRKEAKTCPLSEAMGMILFSEKNWLCQPEELGQN